MEFNLKRMNSTELIDFMTGRTILNLGHGDKLRDIVYDIFETTLNWRIEHDKDKGK